MYNEESEKYKKNINYDNYSDKSGKSYVSNKNDEDKKKQSLLKIMKKNHNVFDVISIVCEYVQYNVRVHLMACDIYGDILKYIYLDNIYIDIIKKEKIPVEKERIAHDLKILKTFIKRIKPDVIVVGIRDIPSYLVYSYIVNMFNKNNMDKSNMKEENDDIYHKDKHGHKYDDHKYDDHKYEDHKYERNEENLINPTNNKYHIIPESLYIPNLLTNSLKYSKELVDKYTREALMCLSLCHYVQNPLGVVISLFDEDTKSMLIKVCLHDLQNYICNYKLQYLFERVMIDVVNKIGCDINFLRKQKKKHLENSLNYICGLGLRKREELMKLLHNTNLNTREDLLTLSNNKKFIGKCVYRNCSSFIRIISNGDDFVEALDNTRIHPSNCYDIIYDMLKNTVEKKNSFMKNKDLYELVNYLIDKKRLIKHIEIKDYARKY